MCTMYLGDINDMSDKKNLIIYSHVIHTYIYKYI